MKFQRADGGRKAAGYKGKTGDCFVRALSIASGMGYQEAYDFTNSVAKGFKLPKNHKGKSDARTGVHKIVAREIMSRLGWTWVPTMKIGQGCTVHLREDEIPAGRLLVTVSRHYVAVVNGVIHDDHDPSREGTRCVYGYYQKKEEAA